MQVMLEHTSQVCGKKIISETKSFYHGYIFESERMKTGNAMTVKFILSYYILDYDKVLYLLKLMSMA